MESTVLLFWFDFSLFALQLAINRVLTLIKNDQSLDKDQIQVESIQHKENAWNEGVYTLSSWQLNWQLSRNPRATPNLS